MEHTHRKKDRPAVQAEVHGEPAANPASDLGELTGDGHANPASDLTEPTAELAARLEQAEARATELETKLKEAEARLSEAEAKAADNLDGWRRAQADLDNFRRRVERDRDDLARFAAEKLILRLLPVVDNLDLAKKSAETATEVGPVRDGINLIVKQFGEALSKEGVEPIDADGKPFDPEFHEAVMRVDSDEYPDNTVVEVFRRGYLMYGKVIRAAMCKVSRKP
ncbi:MAG: nucleotide exchange factor GrpE [Pseudomonadota bacterium]